MEFKVVRNDIAKMETDVVVLPANRRLAIGTGASMALFEAAGRRELEAECAMQLGEAKRRGIKLVPGVSIPTLAYRLPSKIILHTVVPRWRANDPGGSYDELCKAYSGALSQADGMGCESIAFPFLSAGNNGFDVDLAIDIAVKSLERYEPKYKLRQAYLVAFGGDVTHKMRDRGYEVEESIDQVHVLEQGAHQAQAWQHRAGRDDEARISRASKPNAAQMVDKGMRWLLDPENMKFVAALAVGVAQIAVPSDEKHKRVHDVLDLVDSAIGRGKGGKSQ